MDNNRRLNEFSSSHQLSSHNSNLHIPPPPLPPRFPHPNMPFVPPPAPFPLQTHPNYPLYRQPVPPPVSGSSVYPPSSWDNQPRHLTPVNHPPPLTHNSENAHHPFSQHLHSGTGPGGISVYSPSLNSTMAHPSIPVNQQPLQSKQITQNSDKTQDPSSSNQYSHSTTSGHSLDPLPSWDRMVHPSNYLVNQPPTSMRSFTQDQENAQEWVDRWTMNKSRPDISRCDVKIHTIKQKLDNAFKLIRQLENSSRTLGVMVKTVTTEEWEKKCNEVEENKIKLKCIFDELNLTEAEIICLRGKISKRAKKRARLRRQSDRLKIQTEEEKVKEQNLHVQIDNWQREMQERVERVKREEDLKKEADAVLWGVTQKKTEAKRQVAMLAALLNLRSVRVARLTAAGLPVSQSQIDTFNTVIERLKSMWSHHLEECQLEEQALRGMLGSSLPSDTSDEVTTHKKLVLNEWEVAIFGSIGNVDTPLGPDELFDVREESSPLPPRSPGDSPILNLDHSPIRRSSSFHSPSVNCSNEKLRDENLLQPDVSGNCSLFRKDQQGLKHLSGSAPSVTCVASPSIGIPLTPSTCQSRQKKFLRHFDVHPDERVIDYFSCALVADILLQGHLYISKNYFAFYSSVFGYVTKLLIPVSTVTTLTKEKTAFILPNAVAVVTADNRHVFSSLLSRDTTYRLMVEVWREAHACLVDITEPDTPANKPRCRSVAVQRAPLAEHEVPLSDKSLSCSEPTLTNKISPNKSPTKHVKQPVGKTEKDAEAGKLPKSTVLLAASTLLLVLLFASATVLMYRLSLLHHHLTAMPSSASHRSLLEVQEYLDANLQKLHKVRQSLEVLSLLMEEEREHLLMPGTAQDNNYVLPDSLSEKSENNNKINDYNS